MVDVGKGVGVVEAISIRTIRLRDFSGTLHTIPFSEVTTVKNMTRDFAYAVHDVGVALSRRPRPRDRGAAARLQTRCAPIPHWPRYILAPLEVVGLDRFTDSAQVIRVRLKTAPMQQLDGAARIQPAHEKGVRPARHRDALGQSDALSRPRRPNAKTAPKHLITASRARAARAPPHPRRQGRGARGRG